VASEAAAGLRFAGFGLGLDCDALGMGIALAHGSGVAQQCVGFHSKRTSCSQPSNQSGISTGTCLRSAEVVTGNAIAIHCNCIGRSAMSSAGG
jgi:hypothetical protein